VIGLQARLPARENRPPWPQQTTYPPRRAWRRGGRAEFVPDHVPGTFSLLSGNWRCSSCNGWIPARNAHRLPPNAVSNSVPQGHLGSPVAIHCRATLTTRVFGCSGMLPVVSLTLPLVSYGGSSLIAMMTAAGVLISINMRRYLF
jgi:Cell cycle protein